VNPVHRIPLAEDRPFDLDGTLACGQLFRWRREDDTWVGVVGDAVISARQEGSVLLFEGAEERRIEHYFQLDLDLPAILATVDRDPFIHAAIERHRGLRLVRQDPWECLISYICAQNASIPFIQCMIGNMARNYGTPLSSPRGVQYTFPGPEILAILKEEDLRRCSLGYRSGYVLDAARRVCDDPGWAGRIDGLSFEQARCELMGFRGVGRKVADCILLFAFQKFESFPVDVWMRRVMREHYLPCEDPDRAMSCREYDAIAAFAREYFGEYAGYAQEYLFAEVRACKKR
jgi:N-glycosylase/DNA lyase